MLKKIFVTMLILVALIPLATAASVDPVLNENWSPSGGPDAECERAGGCGDFAYKIDDWNQTTAGVMDGTFTHEGNTITISNSTPKTFDWDSDFPVCTVIVKASTAANLYYYAGAYSDTQLIAPYDKEISHVTFCFSRDNEIPEFPTVALPIAAILGISFIFLRRKQ